VLGVLDHVVHKVGADETGAAGDENLHGWWVLSFDKTSVESTGPGLPRLRVE
jgi:hypothetical protein